MFCIARSSGVDEDFEFKMAFNENVMSCLQLQSQHMYGKLERRYQTRGFPGRESKQAAPGFTATLSDNPLIRYV
jgi:hypothetical protein